MSNTPNTLSPTPSSDQSGFASGFLLGLVVGGAGGYFLTTNQGRKLLKDLTAQAGDKFESLKDLELVQNLLSKLDNLPTSEEEVINLAKAKLGAAAAGIQAATTKPKSPPKKRLFSSGGSPVKK